jgi:CBS domain containing-hemolysin-like protein
VAGEFSLVAVDRARVRRRMEENDRRAGAVERSLRRLSFELSGAQLGITATSLIFGAIAEPTVARMIEPALGRFGFLTASRPEVAITLALILGTLVQMLFGELVPKNLAIARPYGTAVAVAIPMGWVNGIMRPAILVLNRAANWTVRRLGIEPREDLAGVRSLEELRLMIRSSGGEGELDAAEISLLTKAILFTEKVAVDVMVPRIDVQALSRHDSVSELRRLARETGHSRFPVFGEDLDEVVGLVHVKDSFRVPQERRPVTPVTSISVPALLVPDSRPLDELLVEMQSQARTMAVVVDEYGGTAGIVTIEDLLEELLGEIADEYDRPPPEPEMIRGARLQVPGRANRHDLKDQVGFEMPEGRFETLGGFLIAHLGRFPTEGEVVVVGGWGFEILAMDGRRVDLVAITPPPETAP